MPVGAVRVDGRGKYLIPGLADMHVHINRSYQNGIYDIAAAEHRLFMWLAAGVTTVRNMDLLDAGMGDRQSRLDLASVLRLRAKAAACEILSPRIYTSGSWTRRPRQLYPPLDSVAAYVTAYKAAGYDFLKVHDESEQLVDSLGAAARRAQIPIVGHVGRAEWAFKAGVASIEHLTGYFQNGQTLREALQMVTLNRAKFVEAADSLGNIAPGKVTALMSQLQRSQGDTLVEADIPALAAATRRAGVWNSPTMALEEGQSSQAEMTARRRVVKALQEAGAGLLLGTDAIDLPGNSTIIHKELTELVAAGLTPYQALMTGTGNVAVFLKTQDSTGTVAVGKRADLVLLTGNPLDDIRHTAEPAGIMLGGRWLDRAELDRLAVSLAPGKRVELYGPMVLEADGVLLEQEILPDTQQMVLVPLLTAHYIERKAFFDSLRPSGDSLTAHPRVIRLLARQLGEYRVKLTPQQQQVFDGPLRQWKAKREKEGYQVEIPGMGR